MRGLHPDLTSQRRCERNDTCVNTPLKGKKVCVGQHKSGTFYLLSFLPQAGHLKSHFNILGRAFEWEETVERPFLMETYKNIFIL